MFIAINQIKYWISFISFVSIGRKLIAWTALIRCITCIKPVTFVEFSNWNSMLIKSCKKLLYVAK